MQDEASEGDEVGSAEADRDADATNRTPNSRRSTLRRRKRRKRRGAQPGDIVLSSHFACTDCGISFEAPTPQLFSFNSPQGMCLDVRRAGRDSSASIPELLVPIAEKSFKQGCIELIGPWKDLGRWKRHIYRGVAETMERKLELAEGHAARNAVGRARRRAARHLAVGHRRASTSRSPGGPARQPQKYGGTFDGIIPELLDKYRTSKSAPQIRQLEQYMSVIRCPDCHGAAAQSAGARGDAHDGERRSSPTRPRARCPKCASWPYPTRSSSSPSSSSTATRS